MKVGPINYVDMLELNVHPRRFPTRRCSYLHRWLPNRAMNCDTRHAMVVVAGDQYLRRQRRNSQTMIIRGTSWVLRPHGWIGGRM